MKKILFHATPKENIFSIQQEGIKAGIDGVIYFCETPENCLTYMGLYMRMGKFKNNQFAIVPIAFTEKEFSRMGVNIDNSAELPTAYAYSGDIAAERIPKDLNEIPLYKISI